MKKSLVLVLLLAFCCLGLCAGVTEAKVESEDLALFESEGSFQEEVGTLLYGINSFTQSLPVAKFVVQVVGINSTTGEYTVIETISSPFGSASSVATAYEPTSNTYIVYVPNNNTLFLATTLRGKDGEWKYKTSSYPFNSSNFHGSVQSMTPLSDGSGIYLLTQAFQAATWTVYFYSLENYTFTLVAYLTIGAHGGTLSTGINEKESLYYVLSYIPTSYFNIFTVDLQTQETDSRPALCGSTSTVLGLTWIPSSLSFGLLVSNSNNWSWGSVNPATGNCNTLWGGMNSQASVTSFTYSNTTGTYFISTTSHQIMNLLNGGSAPVSTQWNFGDLAAI